MQGAKRTATAALNTTLGKGLETLLNEANRLDEMPGDAFASLHDRVIALQLKDLQQTFYLLFTEYGVSVQPTLQGEADAELATDLPALVNLFQNGELKHAESSGDAALADRFIQAVGGIDIDWEEHLSHYTGDLLAFKIGHAVRSLKQRSQQSRRDAGDTLREYLQFELEAVPTRSQVEHFIDHVGDTSEQVDALEKRIDALSKTGQHRN